MLNSARPLAPLRAAIILSSLLWVGHTPAAEPSEQSPPEATGTQPKPAEQQPASDAAKTANVDDKELKIENAGPPDRFIPTEEISEDASVAFPVDI